MTLTPNPVDALQRTRSHLRVLGILFIVLGVLFLLAVPGVLVLHFLGLALLENPELTNLPPEEMEMLRTVLQTLSLAGALLIVVHVVFHVLVGVCLMRYKHYWACYLTAVLSLLNLPLGTALGVFTMIVLARPEARQLFGLVPGPGYPPMNANL